MISAHLAINQNNLIGTVKYSQVGVCQVRRRTRPALNFILMMAETNGPSKNLIDLFGVATMKWTYGKPAGDNQKATLKVTMSGNGNGNDVDRLDDSASISRNLFRQWQRQPRQHADRLPAVLYRVSRSASDLTWLKGLA